MSGALAQLQALRATAANRQALDEFLARGVPTARDENWRYANLRPLDKASFAPPPVPASVDSALLPEALADHARYVFVDGLFAAVLSSPASQSGLAVLTGRAPALPATDGADQGFALLNHAFAADGADIRVAADTRAAVEVVFLSTGTAAAYPRLSVRLEANARLSLVERHLAPAGAVGLVDTAVNLVVGDGATLEHYRLQQAGGVTWIDTLSASIGGAASYNTHLLQLGAVSARSTAHVRLARPAAALEFNAVAVADERQVLDGMLVVEHQAPHTRTVENFRGIAGGRSRIAFNGKINVRDSATKADSAQSLRGLIAGPEAEIDVRPQLEIYTDDVRCSHGATTGKLDDNMLFYLLSRGLEPQVAQRLLKWAFITDIMARIALPQLRQQAQLALVGHMQDTAALKELL